MPFRQRGEVEFFRFPGLDDEPIVQAIFTRRGGVSPAPWSSLNVGGTVGDEPERVRENLRRALASAGRMPDTLHEVWQVHSAKIVRARAPRKATQPLEQADGMVTDDPSVTLFMRFADCVPILLYEPERKVVGLVHAGWRGTLKDAAGAAVQAISGQFGANPDAVLAAIGPSICQDHYPVGPEVADAVRASFGNHGSYFLRMNGSTAHFDLWEANRWLLNRAGVGEVEIAGLCTACSPERWFSHRGERGRTGRFGALIGLLDT